MGTEKQRLDIDLEDPKDCLALLSRLVQSLKLTYSEHRAAQKAYACILQALLVKEEETEEEELEDVGSKD